MNNVELSWWRINLNHLRLPKKPKIIDPVAITVTSANRKEAKLIAEWCKQLPVLARRTTYFNGDLVYTRTDGSKYHMFYVENERIIVGNSKDIEKLENLLSTIPQRCYEILVEDIDIEMVKQIVKGRNVRIVSDDQQKHLVSFNDPDLRIELVLRSN